LVARILMRRGGFAPIGHERSAIAGFIPVLSAGLQA